MRVAILGTWHVHTREYTEAVINNENSTLVGVWEPDIQNGKKFAEQYGVEHFADLDELLKRQDIDSVVVCTATNQHYDVIIKAAKAGKNIFTEKVLAFITKQAEEIKKAIDGAGVKFTISYPHLTWPTLKAAKQILESGVLGNITYARVRNVHDGASANWLPDHFYDKEQCGGGAMMDLGAHPMYTLYWLLGEPKSIISMFTKVTDKAVEDNAVSVIEFENGAVGVSETGFVSQDNPYTLELSGMEGSLMVHGNTVGYACTDTDRKWIQIDTLPQADKLPIHQWIDAINNDTVAPFDTNMAYALTKLMEGAYKSYESGNKHIF